MSPWLVIGINGVTCGGKTTLAHGLREYFQNQRNLQLWNSSYNINDVRLISQDDYFLPVDDIRHQWHEKLNAINFELITSLNMKQMMADIAWTLRVEETKNSRTTTTTTPAATATTNTSEHKEQHYHYQQFQQHHNQYKQQQQQQQFAYLTQNNNNQRHGPQQQQQQQQQKSAPNPRQRNNLINASAQNLSNTDGNNINILIIEGFMIFNQPELLMLCHMKFHFHLPYEKCFERRRKRTYDPPDVTGYFELCVWPHYEKNFNDYRNNKSIIFLNGEIDKEKIFKFALQKIVAFFDEHCDLNNCPPPQKIHAINMHIQSVQQQLQQLQQQQQHLKKLQQQQQLQLLQQQQQQQQQQHKHEFVAPHP